MLLSVLYALPSKIARIFFIIINVWTLYRHIFLFKSQCLAWLFFGHQTCQTRNSFHKYFFFESGFYYLSSQYVIILFSWLTWKCIKGNQQLPKRNNKMCYRRNDNNTFWQEKLVWLCLSLKIYKCLCKKKSNNQSVLKNNKYFPHRATFSLSFFFFLRKCFSKYLHGLNGSVAGFLIKRDFRKK